MSQCARAARAASERLPVRDRTIVLDQHDRFGLSPGLRSKETVELLQMGDEIAAALCRAGQDDELARDVIERPSIAACLACPGATRSPSSPTSPRRGRDRDVSAPRSHRRREG